jgi:hypothetical protein
MTISHETVFGQRGVTVLEICSFYRDSKCIATGKSLGFCDLDDFESICEGDFRFCEKSDVVRKYFLDQKGEEEAIPH